MGNKKAKPRMYGLIVGIVVGVLIGFAQRNWIEHTLNGEFVHVLNTLTLIICAVVGYMIGRAVDKKTAFRIFNFATRFANDVLTY